jgi:hypothetical protein
VAHTTPPSPINVEQAFPELAAYRKVAMRLHPRPGSPGVADSSMGGQLLWPAGEPWPVCSGGDGDHRWYGPAPEAVPLVPVLQLYARDVPTLPFVDGTDVLQVLWCPYDHAPRAWVKPALRWRASSQIAALAAEVPWPPDPQPDGFVPRPCVLDPEAVVEYPSWDLPDDLYERFRAAFGSIRRKTGTDYHTHAADAPGTKAGGYPGWTQEPSWPVCGCGAAMGHLLTVASWEFDRASMVRWLPEEDRAAGIADIGNIGDPIMAAVMRPAGLMLGDCGGVYLFVCPHCSDRPFDWRFDCS